MDADAALVVAFLNTLDVGTGADELATQAGWDAWAAAQPPHLPAGSVDAARAARQALRAAAAGEPTPDHTVTVAAGVVDGRPVATAADAVGAVLLAAARIDAAGRWSRLKLCVADDCRWAFLDESRNRSRAWCSMDVCGNRAKARAFRARQRRP